MTSDCNQITAENQDVAQIRVEGLDGTSVEILIVK